MTGYILPIFYLFQVPIFNITPKSDGGCYLLKIPNDHDGGTSITYKNADSGTYLCKFKFQVCLACHRFAGLRVERGNELLCCCDLSTTIQDVKVRRKEEESQIYCRSYDKVLDNVFPLL